MVVAVQSWAGSISKHSRTELPERKNSLLMWKRRKREVGSPSHTEGLWAPGCVVTHFFLHQVTYLSSVKAQRPKMPPVCGLAHRGTWHKGCPQVLSTYFADAFASKLVDLAQEQVTFHTPSTSSKICLNFYSLVSNGERTKIKEYWWGLYNILTISELILAKKVMWIHFFIKPSLVESWI